MNSLHFDTRNKIIWVKYYVKYQKYYGLNVVVDDMREGPLQFSVPECQGFKSCFSSPPSCWLEDPQCIFVSWKRDPATGSIFTFEGMRVLIVFNVMIMIG